jgi:hypothetical protein
MSDPRRVNSSRPAAHEGIPACPRKRGVISGLINSTARHLDSGLLRALVRTGKECQLRPFADATQYRNPWSYFALA